MASKGLTVNKDFKAVVRAADGAETNMPFTYVTVPTVGADGKTTTVLEFDLANKSGQLVITYTAVVNKDIIDMGNKVTNKAAVSRDTEMWNTPVEFDSYTLYGGWKKERHVRGTEVSQTPLKFIKIVDGEYRLAEANENGAVTDVETTTGDVKIMEPASTR